MLYPKQDWYRQPDSLIFYALSPANDNRQSGCNSLSGILSNSSSVHPVNRLADAVRNKLFLSLLTNEIIPRYFLAPESVVLFVLILIQYYLIRNISKICNNACYARSSSLLFNTPSNHVSAVFMFDLK
jgi:hypothetical protein